MDKKRVTTFLIFFLLLCTADFCIKKLTLMHIPLMNWSSPNYPYGGIALFQNWLGIDASINYVTNQGGAWGIFATYPKYLLLFRCCSILLLTFYTFFLNKESYRNWPLFLIIAGATANVIDCFLYGHVIDMMRLNFWGYVFPIFNLADMAIFFGAIFLAWHLMRGKKKTLQTL